jgi:hypothetical protein
LTPLGLPLAISLVTAATRSPLSEAPATDWRLYLTPNPTNSRVKETAALEQVMTLNLQQLIERDSKIVQAHLADALIDHTKLVGTVVVWNVLLRSAFLLDEDETYPGIEQDVIAVESSGINNATIGAMQDLLEIMLVRDVCVYNDPWRSFAQLGITTKLSLPPALI